jgi:hypothetical protein
MGTAFDSNEN